jgi:hypothetical protein
MYIKTSFFKVLDEVQKDLQDATTETVILKKVLWKNWVFRAVENYDTGQDHPSKEYLELLEGKATCHLRSTVSYPMRIGETHVGRQGSLLYLFPDSPQNQFFGSF